MIFPSSLISFKTGNITDYSFGSKYGKIIKPGNYAS